MKNTNNPVEPKNSSVIVFQELGTIDLPIF